MRVGKVGDVDVVADSRAIGGGIIDAHDGDRRADATRGVQRQGHQMCLYLA